MYEKSEEFLYVYHKSDIAGALNKSPAKNIAAIFSVFCFFNTSIP